MHEIPDAHAYLHSIRIQYLSWCQEFFHLIASALYLVLASFEPTDCESFGNNFDHDINYKNDIRYCLKVYEKFTVPLDPLPVLFLMPSFQGEIINPSQTLGDFINKMG